LPAGVVEVDRLPLFVVAKVELVTDLERAQLRARLLAAFAAPLVVEASPLGGLRLPPASSFSFALSSSCLSANSCAALGLTGGGGGLITSDFTFAGGGWSE
jgi:hypothetical protein